MSGREVVKLENGTVEVYKRAKLRPRGTADPFLRFGQLAHGVRRALIIT